MEYVEAIKERTKIIEIKEILYKRSKRDYLLFTMGINTGLKISEILTMKKHQIIDHSGKLAESFDNGTNYYYFNKQVRNALQIYLATVPNLSHDDYLFRSKKGDLPITRQQAYRIINNVAKEVGIVSKIGTHTLRKTFGYHAYRGGVAVSLLQKIFHHSSRGETLKYIGIEHPDIPARIDVNL